MAAAAWGDRGWRGYWTWGWVGIAGKVLSPWLAPWASVGAKAHWKVHPQKARWAWMVSAGTKTVSPSRR